MSSDASNEMLSLLKELSVYKAFDEDYRAGAKDRMETEAYEARDRRRLEIKQEMHNLVVERKGGSPLNIRRPDSIVQRLQRSKSILRPRALRCFKERPTWSNRCVQPEAGSGQKLQALGWSVLIRRMRPVPVTMVLTLN